jgi:hypothetical protein
MAESNDDTTTPPKTPSSPTEQLDHVAEKKLEYLHRFHILKRHMPHMNINIPNPDTSLEDLKARYKQHITEIKQIEEQEQQKQLEYAYQLLQTAIDKQPKN